LKSKLKFSIATVSALAILMSTSAFAQAAKEEEKAKAKKTSADTIVVTGSRIRKNTFTSASPLSVITTDNAKLGGKTDPAKVIYSTPAASGSSQINNFYTGFVVEGGPGIQTVGLNSLGSQRTLVMLNTHRLPPSGVRGQVGAVDLATIPSLAINRYEILNEGASPVYGSDAVGGVVNAITRKDANGLEVSASGNASLNGGGESFTVGALWGKTADKWNVMVSGEYFEQKALKYKDRDWCQEDYVFDANGNRADYKDANGNPMCFGLGAGYGYMSTGLGTFIPDASQTANVVGVRKDYIFVPAGTPIPVGPSAGQVFTTARCVTATGALTTSCNGVLSVPGYRRVFGPQYGQLGQPVANQINYVNDKMLETDIISPSKRTNFYTTLSRDLDILGGVELYGEGLYAKRESSQTRTAQLFFPSSIAASNPLNPFGVYGSAATPVAVRPANNAQVVETWQVLAGLKGNTGKGIFGLLKNGGWDFYAQQSEGSGEYSGSTVLYDRLNASLTTTKDSNGNLVCSVVPASYSKCVPINFFDPRIAVGNYTDEEMAYLFTSDNNTGKTVYKQTVAEFNVSGDLFRIPGASDEVKANIGAHYRKYSINDVPGAETLAGNQALTSAAGITKGEDAVKEMYTEITAPLIAKKPLIEDLSITAAYRYTDYDSYDKNETWKLTTQWKITPQFKLVGIAGTSYRAPALYELFLGDQTSFVGQISIDPCVNWGQSNNDIVRARCGAEGVDPEYTGAGTSSATVYSGGGFGALKEEESRSDIFSMVWTPENIDLNLRLDFWKIKVTDQVDSFGAASIVGACYTDTTGRSEYFCNLFNRDMNPTSSRYQQILTIDDAYVNINQTLVQGIDVKALYRKEFPFGDLTVDSQHRWNTSYKTGLFSDEELYENSGLVGFPGYVSQTQLRFKKKDWTYAWTIEATGPADNSRLYVSNTSTVAPGTYYAGTGLTSITYKRKVETTVTHNFNVQYKNDNYTLVGGINNVFDEPPPAISVSSGSSRLGYMPLASQYDFIGRSVFMSLTKRF
jgi:iron complex outermembrane recepter protein